MKANDVYDLSGIQQSSLFYYKSMRLSISDSIYFIIYVKPNIPIEEKEEIKRLYNNYRTYMKTVINYLKECHQSSELSEEAIIKYEQSKEDAWQKCMELNDEWNKSLAVEREKREILAFEKQIEEARLLMKETDDFKREKQEEIEKLIKEQKELSSTFITEENIDAHIEDILNKEPFSFNYAIDLKGKIYEGYNKNPSIDKFLDVKSSNKQVEEAVSV
ncbi:hypothetical protein PGB90_006806 [Kerria lacca]